MKPERDANARATYRTYWWRYGEARRELRAALQGLPRYIATVETSKFRFFTLLDAKVAPDNMLICIASADAFHLGVLSFVIHIVWALAAGGRLGIGNDPRYNKTVCFDPFPFPDPAPELRAHIAELAERLDQHRKDAIARDERVTMTGIYNIIEKLRSGEALTSREKQVHLIAACGMLRDAHEDLDRLVAEAYGWPWPMERDEILERLVALHEERVEQERAGRVRWLRPEYQMSRFGRDLPIETAKLGLESQAEVEVEETVPQWPAGALEQIAALKRLAGNRPWSVEEAAASFRGARREIVSRHLETLAILGELQLAVDGRYRAVA